MKTTMIWEGLTTKIGGQMPTQFDGLSTWRVTQHARKVKHQKTFCLSLVFIVFVKPNNMKDGLNKRTSTGCKKL